MPQQKKQSLSDFDRGLILHSLGVTSSARGRPYRNYFAANPGDIQLASMERRGLMKCFRRPNERCSYGLYGVTRAGYEAAGVEPNGDSEPIDD